MSVHVGVRGPGHLSRVGGGWQPANLGASLLGLWDAERGDLITAAGGAVSSWKDIVAGYDAVQATGASKPTYSASSFNSRPGVSFDGTDDNLRLPSQPFPSGATPCEIWVLASQDAASADVGTRRSFAYGGVTNNDTRYMTRSQVSSVGVAVAATGTGAATTSSASLAATPYEGRHITRGAYTATTVGIELDGVATAPTAGVSATATTEVRIGCGTNGSGFWTGPIALIAVTGALTTTQADAFRAYLKARGGTP